MLVPWASDGINEVCSADRTAQVNACMKLTCWNKPCKCPCTTQRRLTYTVSIEDAQARLNVDSCTGILACNPDDCNKTVRPVQHMQTCTRIRRTSMSARQFIRATCQPRYQLVSHPIIDRDIVVPLIASASRKTQGLRQKRPIVVVELLNEQVCSVARFGL